MKDLIEALQILSKYMNPESRWPTQCEHDTLYVCGINREVTEEDLKRLEELGFHQSEEEGNFKSYRFGSC